MKELINILLCLILTFNFGYSQVPQGVGYQGVATDANGIELVNQSISIRASVLSGSATGTIEWEETHATTTDTFGLFTLTIGEGTNTTNGAQTSFADISWGANTHFLKIEMDVNGGTNYSYMGTNQMMSVPYALYAENANIDYDSIATILSNDSSFINNFSFGGNGGGCNFNYPDGLNGDPVLIDLIAGPYTVPTGKNLYIQHLHTVNANSIKIQINNTDAIAAGTKTLETPYIVKSGDVIDLSLTGQFTEFNISGILIPQQQDINPVLIDLIAGPYTVPTGKNLYIQHLHTVNANSIKIQINNTDAIAAGTKTLETPYIVKSGDVIDLSFIGQFVEFNISGYLVDENYFAGCGGGGSSSTTTINYDSLATIISMDSTFLANLGGGGNMVFGDWELKYDNPSSTLLYGQENQDGFLYVKVHKASGGSFNSSYTIDFYTGPSLDTITFNMDISGKIKDYSNSYDIALIPIKKDWYWLINGGVVDQVYFLPLVTGSSSSSASNGSNSTNTYGGTMPSWVYNTGMCSDNIPQLFQSSNNIVSSANMSLNGDHSFCNFTLNANDTLTINGDYLILRVADTLTINGTIDGSGKVVSSVGEGVSGGNGGSAGGMQSLGGNGYPTLVSKGNSSSYIDASILLSSNGSVVDSSFYYQMILNESKIYGAHGGNGGSTRYWDAYNVQTYGGNGGAGLIIICKYLQFNGTINLSGLAGQNGTIGGSASTSSYARVNGGGGGGGAGSLIINAENVVSNTGLTNLNGGLGGNSPNIYFPQITSPGFYANWYGNSGNPGGDGFIIWLGDQ